MVAICAFGFIVVGCSGGRGASALHHKLAPGLTDPTASSQHVARSASPGFYTLLGCKIFNGDMTAINRVVTSIGVDPNSAAIILHVNSISSADFASGQVDRDEQVNSADSSTPLVPWTGTLKANTGAVPPTIPWGPGSVIEISSDRHAHVINTQNCSAYETYDTTYSGGLLSIGSGTYYPNISTQNYAPEAASITVVYEPMFGMMDTGDDVTAYQNKPCPANPTVACFPHVVQFYGTAQAVQTGYYIFPAGGVASGSRACTLSTCLIAGDMIRLHASVPCPTSGVGEMVCNQLKYYGASFSDTSGCGSAGHYWGIRTGYDTNGNDQLAGAAKFFSSIHITDFDLLQRPAIKTGAYSFQC
jgi:hypothetical protein